MPDRSAPAFGGLGMRVQLAPFQCTVREPDAPGPAAQASRADPASMLLRNPPTLGGRIRAGTAAEAEPAVSAAMASAAMTDGSRRPLDAIVMLAPRSLACRAAAFVLRGHARLSDGLLAGPLG
ncbi:MAG TPA: hypothetical protein VLX31_08220 [Streptosporangiaceae bacterium]|nr:hypothetical protein [Streptosporangiaceae bacterium]